MGEYKLFIPLLHGGLGSVFYDIWFIWCLLADVVFSRGVGWGLVRGVGGDLESCSVMRNVVYWGERNAWFFEGARNEYGEAKICDFETLI